MRKLFLSCMALVAACTTVNAQTDSNIFNHMAVGVELGTTGIGVEVAAPVTNYVQVRAGVSIMPTIKAKDISIDISAKDADWNNVKKTVTDLQAADVYSYISAEDKKLVDGFTQYLGSSLPHDVLINGEVGMTNFKFLVDVYPFKGSFHLTAGVYTSKSQFAEVYTTNCQDQFNALTYFNQNLAGKTIKATTPLGEVPYTFGKKIGVEMGDYLLEPNGNEVRGFVKVGGVKPYVGLGFGRAVPQKHRLAFNFDLGAMLWGSPKIYVAQKNGEVQLDESGIDGDGGIIKTVSKINVFPCMTFRLTGRIF